MLVSVSLVRYFAYLMLTGLAMSDLSAEDWPMWRKDPQRTAVTTGSPGTHLQWVRQNSPLTPAFRNPRLHFDKGYEPVVLGKTLFYGSSRNDSLTALDTETGNVKWTYFTEGPVRFAPVAWKENVYVGSDDGHLHCLDIETGKLRWKFRAVPSQRRLLGNGRLISVWPVRGGPVLSEGRIYFAAGILPLEGVFVYSLDADTGEVLWLNDRSGYLYGQHPHNAQAFGGLSPQGYLVINGDELLVPCGPTLPGTFDLSTGTLKEFNLPKPGRLPGGWFASIHSPDSKAIRRGKVVYDSSISRQRHEDKLHIGHGEPGVRSKITVDKVDYAFTNSIPGVEDEIHTMVVADNKRFVVTVKGTLYCFGKTTTNLVRHDTAAQALPPTHDRWRMRARQLLEQCRTREGHALVWGLGQGRLAEELALQSKLKIIGIDPDEATVDRLRRRWDNAGLYGTQISLLVGQPSDIEFPPYLADLIVSENLNTAGLETDAAFSTRVFECLRPYGGVAGFYLPKERTKHFEEAVKTANLPNATMDQVAGMTVLRREGALPGAANYTGTWKSIDQRINAPLGALWFDDKLGHFKRSPQPHFVDGVMMSRPKAWLDSVRPYTLLPPVFSDVYTGRILPPSEVDPGKFNIPAIDPPQPVQYRPPGFAGNTYDPPRPVVGRRINPLTGMSEPRTFPRSYGCDGGIDYGRLYTMRSGTAAIYDKGTESGIINISGPRSGCSNSVIPANGVLNVPYFYEGCTCSYPLPVGLALISMPARFEQWTAWGQGPTNNIQRVGINLGAPGDRITDAGTLWLDHPSVGGPSPGVLVSTKPDNPKMFYHHSLWVTGGIGWPWVAASGAMGLNSLTLSGLKDTTCTIRLYFIEPDNLDPGQRLFDVTIQGKTVLTNLDIVEKSNGRMKALVEEFKWIRVPGTLEVTFIPRKNQPIISGIEVITDTLQAGEIPQLPDTTVATASLLLHQSTFN